MKNVLIVMPIINLWEQYVSNALKSIVSKENNIKILAIDNGSIDGTLEQLKKIIIVL
jgi:glycosyltransferase involved in cell wall biosynthesis